MPYKPFKVGNEYCVFKLDAEENKTGSSLGCHPTEEEAYQQIAAIEASEQERSMNQDEQARSLFEEFWQGLKSLVVKRRIKDVDSWDGSASQFESTEAYCAACLIDVNSAAGREEKAQSHCMLPVRGPGDSKDTFVRQAVHAAVGGRGIGAVKRPDDVPGDAWTSAVNSAKSQLRKAYSEMDEEPLDSIARQNDELWQQKLEELRGAFNKQFNDSDSWDSWMIDATDEYVIGEFSGQKYKVPYQIVDNTVVFASREEWRVVDLTYNERAMSLDAINERVFSVAIEKYPMAFFHSTFRDGDGQMFAILTQDDKLYRSPVTITKDKSIELGEWFEVEQEFVPIQTRTTVLRQKDGQYRWFSRSATAVLNRVGEIDSRELFDSFVSHIERTGEYPIRQFWHQGEQFRTGQCDFVARDGYVLVTSGVYDDSELATLEREAVEREPDYWGESIRYKPTKWPTLITLENGKIIPVFRAGYLIEISTLPENVAANLFTTVVTYQQQEVNRMLTGKIWDAFKKLWQEDEEKARAWLEKNVDEVNREIEGSDTIARSEKSNNDNEEASTEGEDESPEVVLDDEAIKAIVAQLQESEVIRSKADNDDVAKLVKMSEEVTRAIEKINEVFEDITKRLEALEKDEDEKKREYQEDMPRNGKINVTYRPRVARAETEEEDTSNEVEAWEEQKKSSNIPSY